MEKFKINLEGTSLYLTRSENNELGQLYFKNQDENEDLQSWDVLDEYANFKMCYNEENFVRPQDEFVVLEQGEYSWSKIKIDNNVFELEDEPAQKKMGEDGDDKKKAVVKSDPPPMRRKFILVPIIIRSDL